MPDSPTKDREDHAEEPRAPEGVLRGLGAVQAAASRRQLLATSWDPPDCGDIDMRIAANGTWFYCGSPIGRAALVQLFASILRKEGDRYVMVTPIEKVGIKVDDAPFLAVEMSVEGESGGSRLTFRTNVEDAVSVDAGHPLRFELGASGGLKPYVKVRGDLWALVKRALFYDLVALGQIQQIADEDWFGVRSDRIFFPMCRASEIEEL